MSPFSPPPDHARHDLGEIAALAGGDGEHGGPAGDLIAACPDCRAEFDLQRRVRGWLEAAPAVGLTDDERVALRERVGRSTRSGSVVASPRTRRPPLLWLRVGYVAAGLAVLAGIGGVLANLGEVGPGPSVEAFDAVAAEAPSGGDEADTTAGAALAATEAQRATLAGGDVEAVRAEVEDMLERAREATGEEAGAPDAEMLAATPCLDETGGRPVVMAADSVLDGEAITILVVAGDEAPEALVFRTGDCTPVDLG